MGAYEYIALNARGAEKKGIMEGDSSRQIRQQLREQNLIPLKVEEAAKRERQQKGKNTLGGGVSIMALALMTRQLATLSRTGTPLADALATVGRQTDKPRMKSLLMALRAQVLEGHTLADAFASFPNVFDNLYVATVRAGEHSGHLDVILERLAEYTETRQQMRQKVQMALLYPVILTVMAIAVVSALLAFVVPQVVQVFQNNGQALPWLTRALIASSDFLRANYPYLIAFIASLIYLFRWLMKKEPFRLRMHRLVLHIPVIGTLVQGMNTARMARTLSILSASSVPLLDAMHISAQVLTNIPMRQSVEQATVKVREGTSLAQALEQSGYFPPLLIQLISGGEASGELEQMLEHAAISQERELNSIIATLFGLLEPLIIVAMGGVVLIIVLAILLPIFEMNQLVH